MTNTFPHQSPPGRRCRRRHRAPHRRGSTSIPDTITTTAPTGVNKQTCRSHIAPLVLPPPCTVFQVVAAAFIAQHRIRGIVEKQIIIFDYTH